MPVLVVTCLLWHDIARRDAPDVLRNLAMDCSTIELLASPAIPSFAVAIHMDWKHTWSHAFYNVPTCILVMIRHCVCWTSSVVGLRFFICLLLLCKLLLCSHRVNLAPYASSGTFKHAVNLLVNLSQACPFLTRTKEKGNNLITRVLATCSLHSWAWIDGISIRKFRLIVDLLAILSGAPRSWMQLYTSGEWPAVGSFESSALHVWPRVLCPSEARLTSKGNNTINNMLSKVLLYHTLLKPWVLPSRLEQSNTFLILKLYCS